MTAEENVQVLEREGLLEDDVSNHNANNPGMKGKVSNANGNSPNGLKKLPGKDIPLKDETEPMVLVETKLLGEGPIDRYHLVYFIMVLNGVAVLMPWNMFITATSYFKEYKLATNTSMNAEYRTNFLSYVGIASQVPNLVLNAINMFAQCGKGSLSVRIIVSIITVILMFIVTVILAMIDSEEWPGIFFAITIVTVIIINMANGVYQNCVYGLAACLPMKYTNAVVLGSNLSGTITSVVMIISIWASPNPRTAAIYYFLTAIFILLVAFDTYFALPLVPFYRHHKLQIKEAQAEEGRQAAGKLPPYWTIFKQCWVQCLSVFCVFFVTLTCFPAIQANISMSDENFFIPKKYFTPVTCFLFFNAFAMFGNITTELIKIPGPRWVWIPVALRLFFIPFFMFCNYKVQDRGFPVLINNDYVYIIAGILMAFTSGYFSSLCMMYAPSTVSAPNQGIAGMMAAFFLILGIVCGVNFSLAVAKITVVDYGYKLNTPTPTAINATLLNGTVYQFLTSPPV